MSLNPPESEGSSDCPEPIPVDETAWGIPSEPEPLIPCGNCGVAISSWRECPHCGAGSGWKPPVVRLRAIPIAPVDDIPIATPVGDVFSFEEDDDIPVAKPVEDYDDEYRPRRRRRRRKYEPPKPNRLIPLFVGYGLMFGILIVSAVLTVALVLAEGGEASEETTNWSMAVFEFACTLLVFFVALAIGRIKPSRSDLQMQVAAWSVAFPMLAVLLAINIGFHTTLRELLKVKHEAGPGLTLVTFLLICLEPAVVEEWFFRHLALGTLREKVGMHGAVWISGAMFGFAHLLNPIGMPYLIMVGVCFGYMRVWSGGLVLPMILHCVHNAVVISADKFM